VTILIRLTGTFQYLNLTFDSDPPMNQSDIISYILFGRSPEALSDQETFKAEEMALSFTGQMAADKIRDVVGDALGIDYLNISTGNSGLRQGSLSMGKYLLPKVFVVFRQGFSDQNSQQFEVSYEINKYFDIQSQIDNEQTSALDLIWKYEF
jgi:translocation and assembly module TamB